MKAIETIQIGDSASFTKTVTATRTVTERMAEKNRLKLETVVTNQKGEQVITGVATVMPPKA